ncbi:hypothetical protein AKJ65_06385 [candidate division MSBL1 archaeon SCGC-AAA259E19]|uniref:Uncharacterized protein n=1 Tax=candidate division MSBL1 archaeon SCGC-AAA259E19 TaxID=1698264 RepID=A0A133UGU4_9EURY|nr:hypothetical protein AKJ65_06385 [candidate division MSBL1 archaeon SCGC-AAA259E19]
MSKKSERLKRRGKILKVVGAAGTALVLALVALGSPSVVTRGKPVMVARRPGTGPLREPSFRPAGERGPRSPGEVLGSADRPGSEPVRSPRWATPRGRDLRSRGGRPASGRFPSVSSAGEPGPDALQCRAPLGIERSALKVER